MKKSQFRYYLLCAAVAIGAMLTAINCAPSGTMSGSVSANITDQPVWGPTGYDRADYYYLPDIDTYYSVSERQYIYRDGSNWRHSASLPAAYSTYDPYHSYKVVVTGDKPYNDNDNHRSHYGKYKGVKDQQVIRDSRDSKYFVVKDHPEHERWAREHRQ